MATSIRRVIIPTERWRTFPEIVPYEVSDQGRVRSPSRLVPYKRTGRMMRLKERILKTQAMPKGHLQVTLLLPSGKKTFFVHRLVLTAFIGPSDLGTRHLNDRPDDNRLVNLAWGTQQENMDDREYTRGADHYSSAFTEQQAIDIRRLIADGHSQREVARLYGVSHTTIGRHLKHVHS